MVCHLMIIESDDLKTKTFLVMAYPTQASGYPNSQEPKTKQSSPWWSSKLPPCSEQGVKGVCGDHVHLVALVICVEAGPGQKSCNQWLSSFSCLSLLNERLKLVKWEIFVRAPRWEMGVKTLASSPKVVKNEALSLENWIECIAGPHESNFKAIPVQKSESRIK